MDLKDRPPASSGGNTPYPIPATPSWDIERHTPLNLSRSILSVVDDGFWRVHKRAPTFADVAIDTVLFEVRNTTGWYTADQLLAVYQPSNSKH